MNTTGQHILNYILAGLAIVAGLSPDLLGVHGVAIVGAAVGVTNILHGFLTGGTTPTPPATGTVAKVHLLAVVLAFVIMLAVLSGCKTAPTATEQAGISVAVDIATGAAIQQGGGTATNWAARASEYKAIALEVKAANDAGTATLSTLAADAAPALAKLPPADQLAARALIAAITPFINQELQSNTKLQTTQAALDDILQAVIDACTAYGA